LQVGYCHPPGCFAKEIHFKGTYGPKSIRDRFH
jgi:hypothetical protein